eukprot:CAMPEP_0194278776 /NCGR_PEP_ID=MMETSP0169-20130528/12090_1 /TAXON_ID=218684 /ORGANISM="Corethron pennatum, Strain L29A3" /LENGTH=189 /DNA_ID=CAMNT_0039023037 /DNA_START=142 /DNA_END=711 /DNA_ORIENTATION=+
MKLQGLRVFLATTVFTTSAVFAEVSKTTKGPKTKKAAKGSKQDCAFIPRFVSEPSDTDKYYLPDGTMIEDDDGEGASMTGGKWVWENNDICSGAIPDKDACSGTNLLGKASGTCTTFPSNDCDSIDYFKFNDGSLLYFRGMDEGKPGPSVVIGGTGCYKNAKGTINTELSEGDEVEAGAWYTYDLSKVM